MTEKIEENKNTFTYVLVGLLVVCAFVIGNLYTKVKMLEKGTGGTNVVGAQAGQGNNQQPPSPQAKADIKVVDSDNVLGNANAKVTVVEYTDYQCPFCERFFNATFGSLKKAYIDTGKIRFVVRDFPLTSIHPNAQKAAEAAQCAGEQKKYYEFHDKLYTTQAEWSADAGDATVTKFKQYAVALGLDANQFNSCLDGGKMAEKITKSTNEGASFGVQGTPAFFINGTLLSGAQPFTAFQTAIDAALK